VPACKRETWNGQKGEQCCRTCKTSNGKEHGPDCKAKHLRPDTSGDEELARRLAGMSGSGGGAQFAIQAMVTKAGFGAAASAPASTGVASGKAPSASAFSSFGAPAGSASAFGATSVVIFSSPSREISL
jgi:hypothetical protein